MSGSQGRVNVQEVISVGLETSSVTVIGDSEESASRRYDVELKNASRRGEVES